MTRIDSVDAWEVLDSRGDPTVRARVEAGGASGTFTVPSGASTGAHEAVERRDEGTRFRGRGVRDAVLAVRNELAEIVEERPVTTQEAIDAALVEADGTENLSRVGANAVLAVSGAVAHAAADVRGEPLYESLATVADRDGPGDLPLPMVNILSGGLHAEGGIEVQDFLVVPVGADSYREALETVWDVRVAVRDRIVDAGHRPLVADEGGFSPPLGSIDDAFELLLDGVVDAGYEPGAEVAFAVDVAASHFYEGGEYRLESLDRTLETEGMVDLVAGWVEQYPVVSVEDPLAEDDWPAWEALADRLADEVQLLGDDLLVTSADRVEQGVDSGAANSVLVKPNQAGTITRAVEVVEIARDAGWATVVSARSGETCDSTIADLAVGLDAGQIKIGSLARSERLAKYNRLLEIDREELGFAGADALASDG